METSYTLEKAVISGKFLDIKQNAYGENYGSKPWIVTPRHNCINIAAFPQAMNYSQNGSWVFVPRGLPAPRGAIPPPPSREPVYGTRVVQRPPAFRRGGYRGRGYPVPPRHLPGPGHHHHHHPFPALSPSVFRVWFSPFPMVVYELKKNSEIKPIESGKMDFSLVFDLFFSGAPMGPEPTPYSAKILNIARALIMGVVYLRDDLRTIYKPPMLRVRGAPNMVAEVVKSMLFPDNE